MLNPDTTPAFLKDALKFGIHLGLERMQALDQALGNLEMDLKVVHIAGTNGKGSVSSYLTHILAASGLKVGVYTSPFLERFSERMRILDGREGLRHYLEDDSYGEIPADVLERLSDKVKEAAKAVTSSGLEDPTEFELVTAICYLWFAEEKVDIAVLETGLGGRLDSTNVFDKPELTLITSIGMDHSDRLGNSIAEITSEKAGIIKPEVPLVIADPDSMILDVEGQKDVRRVIEETAKAKNSPVIYVRADKGEPVYTPAGTMEFYFENKKYETRLMGGHQAGNCSLAVKAAQMLARKYSSITEETISEGVKETRWKCRAEVLTKEPLVLLDGGHNVQGATSLGRVWGSMFGGAYKDSPVRLVIGVMKDKDVEGIIKAYRECGINIKEAYTVKVDNPRTMLPGELSHIIKVVYNHKVDVIEEDDPLKAVASAYESSKKDNIPLLVTGSLYLLGQIRGYLKGLI